MTKRIISIFLLACSVLFSGFTGSNNLKRAPKGSFSIIVIPDTQQYLGENTKIQPDSHDKLTNPVFNSQTKWIINNLDDQKIAFVSHAGDIVDKNIDEQWSLARQFMDRLHGKVPYGLAVGNHDMTSEGNSSLFQKYFPASRFENFSWYGGFYKKDNHPEISGNNANSYQLLSAGGIDFIMMHLECNAPDNVLSWAGNILDKYSNRFAIVTTHMFLGPLKQPETPEGYFNDPKGIMQWNKIHGSNGNSPQQMWNKCLSKRKNLRIIFCGDQSRTNAMHVQLEGENGNPVQVLLSDYMAQAGPLRIYRFLPDKNKIEVITYNPSTNEIVTGTPVVGENAEHNFSIDML